ncbi:sensor histidine kinase [Streptomyces sp. NPDC058171]
MSFRVRLMALLMLIAVAATAATAWLTLRQVSRQVQESAEADRADIRVIDQRLRDHAVRHGTWDGVSNVLRSLAAETGQRIRIQDETGGHALDSDALAGRVPRPAGAAPPILIDPRPRLTDRPEPVPVPRALVKQSIGPIAAYPRSIAFAECLARSGIEPEVTRDDLGIPVYRGPGGSEQSGSCTLREPSEGEWKAVVDALQTCVEVPLDDASACVDRVFVTRTGTVGPQPLRVFLGALDDAGLMVERKPAVLAALGVAGAAVLGALLLSRAVLRPVKALTAAARSLGEGELAQRVPAFGSDEIGELGRSFNRMADSLAASERRQQQLIGDIAHELRTPLGNLRGYLEAIQDGFVEVTPELLASLHEEALLQQRVVDDLQDLALAEAGALTYHRSDLDARDLLTACATAHRALAGEAGVAVEVAAHPVPAPVHGDPARLRQALSNLVGNAVRHTGRGGRVTLRVARPADGVGAADGVGLVVRDTGSGIPAEQLPHLFDRFWRADGARGRTTGGSGLGLPIARQIVADHGGTITVTSEVGRGTAFTVTLPAPSAPRPPHTSHTPTAPTGGDGS